MILFYRLIKEMCRLAKIEYEEEVKRNKEIHDAIAAERARKKYEKHYGICREVLKLMYSFVTTNDCIWNVIFLEIDKTF